MSKLAMLELGPAGLDYVIRSLDSSDQGLCARLRQLPLDSGRVYAVVPEGTGRQQALDFESSMPGASGCYGWLTDRVRQRLIDRPRGTFVVHDLWGKPSDLYWPPDKSHALLAGSDVYFAVDRDNFEERSVEEAISIISTYLLVAAFTAASLPPGLSNKVESVPPALIDRMAAETEEIYLSAYDHDGFVIWSRG